MTWPPDRPPEIPYPFTPGPEPARRADPVTVPVPTVPEPPTEVVTRLFERRTVLVTGPLDRTTATRLCAELMALDGAAGRAIDVVVNSTGGPLGEVPPVLDVLELMRAPVNTTCIGTARGTAAIVLACGTGLRQAAPSASISLRCDYHELVEGTADDVARNAEELQRIRTRLGRALVLATGTADIADELDHGRFHDAEGARRLGLVDEVAASRRSETG